MTTITARIVFSVDAMAKAKGITARHDIDTLVGIATRAMANGDSEILALEAARRHADHQTNVNAAIHNILDQLSQQPALVKQAL